MEWTETGFDDRGYQVIELSGDFDLYSAPGFTRAITELMGSGAYKLKLDLTEVRYLDSSGVGSLIKILQSAKHSGSAIVFCGITGAPRRILQMSNILLLMKEVDQAGGDS